MVENMQVLYRTEDEGRRHVNVTISLEVSLSSVCNGAKVYCVKSINISLYQFMWLTSRSSSASVTHDFPFAWLGRNFMYQRQDHDSRVVQSTREAKQTARNSQPILLAEECFDYGIYLRVTSLNNSGHAFSAIFRLSVLDVRPHFCSSAKKHIMDCPPVT